MDMFPGYKKKKHHFGDRDAQNRAQTGGADDEMIQYPFIKKNHHNHITYTYI